ncbi:MAG: hypothetical protein NZ606_05245 [Candidatus Kapabacteria bacterium]|nr:hypothetical protein [Candidatus Kapabacteria bacterium]
MIVARFALLLVLAVAAQLASRAQSTAARLGILEWRSLTSLLDARDVCADRYGNLWVATGGGIFVADMRTNTIEAEYRPGQGLLALEIQSITSTPDGSMIIAGATDGTLEMLSPDSGAISSLTDIRRAADQYPRRTVNDLLVHGDRVYVATDFGIVIYDLQRGVPLETVDPVASFAPKAAITALALRNDTLIVAGSGGLASVWLGVPSLRDRRQWRSWKLPAGWSWDGNAVGIATDAQGRLVVATMRTILRESGDSLAIAWQHPTDWTDPISGMCRYGDQVLFAVAKRLYQLDGGVPWGKEMPARIQRLRVVLQRGQPILVAALAANGVALVAEDTVQVIKPNSMLANTAYDLAVDTRGNLWVATAAGGRGGSGFACFDRRQWRIFTPQTDNRVPTVNYYRVAATPTGDVWLSSWGAGLLRAVWVSDDSVALEYYNNQNSPLVGFAGNPSYTVPGKAVGDQQGTTWIAHWGNWIQSSSHLIARDVNGRFYGYTYPGNPSSVGYFLHIALDAAGTKWLGSYRTDADGSGLVWFNDGGTLDNTRDDRWGRITTQGTALPSNTITALATDRTGMLWVGTTAGVAVVVNPTAVLSGATPFIRTVRELRGVVINTIAVDALNNKWIGTPNGIWIIGDDGITILGTITQAQYPVLLSNDIRAITTDGAQGILYIGTERGINVLRTIAVAPRQEYQLQLYPQPYDPEQGMLTIEGLAPETELRISTISGVTIRTIRTRSRMVLWDGRDEGGNLLPTGIYLLHAVSEQGNGSAVAKIALVRSGQGR